MLERKVEGTRRLKALPPVICGGHIGFEKLVYIGSVCEKRTTDTHKKKTEGNGKRTRWLICTYICLHIYMLVCVCQKVFKFQTTRHI